MDPNVLFVSIPIVAIVMGIGSQTVKTVLQSRERELEMRLRQQSTGDQADQSSRDLRTELAALRDTSTQFALSIDHTLKRIEQRIDHLERRVGAPDASTASREPTPPAQVVADPGPTQTVGQMISH